MLPQVRRADMIDIKHITNFLEEQLPGILASLGPDCRGGNVRVQQDLTDTPNESSTIPSGKRKRDEEAPRGTTTRQVLMSASLQKDEIKVKYCEECHVFETARYAAFKRHRHVPGAPRNRSTLKTMDIIPSEIDIAADVILEKNGYYGYIPANKADRKAKQATMIKRRPIYRNRGKLMPPQDEHDHHYDLDTTQQRLRRLKRAMARFGLRPPCAISGCDEPGLFSAIYDGEEVIHFCSSRCHAFFFESTIPENIDASRQEAREYQLLLQSQIHLRFMPELASEISETLQERIDRLEHTILLLYQRRDSKLQGSNKVYPPDKPTTISLVHTDNGSALVPNPH